MKHAFKQQMILIMVCLLCSPPCAFGQQPKKERAIPVTELFGKWESEEDGSVVEIGPQERGDNRILALKGKHTWAGSYDGKKLQVIRKVSADEMDDKAPLWARQEVEKQASLFW